MAGRHARQQVGRLRWRDPRLLAQILAVIHVGRASYARTLPGVDEDGPVVGGVGEADGLGDGQAPGGEDEMAAA